MDLVSILQSGILQDSVLAIITGVPLLVVIGLGIVAIFAYRSLNKKSPNA